MKVLVACEFSGIVRDAFRARGHDAWSCDLLPSESDSSYHIQGDVLNELQPGRWDMMIAHPPCTYICIANAPHYNRKKFGDEKVNARLEAQAQSIEFFNLLLNANIPRIAIENPRPLNKLTNITGTYNQVIQPYHFGHHESKTTCIWLKNLPELKPTNVVERGEMMPGIGKRTNPKWSHSLPNNAERWKIRSRTFQGIADAMADQWGH